MKLLVLVGGPWHDNPGTREDLAESIKAYSGAEVTVTDDRADFLKPSFSDYDALLVYTTGGEMSAEEDEAIDRFVRSGKGFIGLHGANTSFKASPKYASLIGTSFIRHPKYAELVFRVERPEHPILEGVGDFNVPDELYMSQWTRDPRGDEKGPKIEVLATSRLVNETDPAGPLGDNPSVYITSADKGRVFYFALGHDSKSISSEPFKRILGQGIRWAVGELN